MWKKLKEYLNGSNQSIWGIEQLKFILKEIEEGKMEYADVDYYRKVENECIL